jgi:hypothetical protein
LVNIASKTVSEICKEKSKDASTITAIANLNKQFGLIMEREEAPTRVTET